MGTDHPAPPREGEGAAPATGAARDPLAPPPAITERLWRLVRGPARSLGDRSVFHRVSLVALLAWVGLGADGLSSSAYGPEEAFRALGEHRSLAVVLALMMVTTVLVISAGYIRIIRQFPHGGGATSSRAACWESAWAWSRVARCWSTTC